MTYVQKVLIRSGLTPYGQRRETLSWEALQLSGEAVPPGLRERQSRCEREGLTKQRRKKRAAIATLGLLQS